MAAVASEYFVICLMKPLVGYVFGSASVQPAGRMPLLVLLLWPFVPGVYLALFSIPNSVF